MVNKELRISRSGNKYWCKDEGYYRLNGPAVELVSGYKAWYKDGNYHRVEGPAVEYSNGSKVWYQNNLMHRIDGPALITCLGDNYWFYQGKDMDCETQEEFERLIKLRLLW